MIQFSPHYRVQRQHFRTTCPVCEVGEVEIAYRLEYEAADPASHEPAYWAAEDPEITSQECRCLIGSDFAQDALDDYLDRPRRIRFGDQLRLF